MSPFRGWKKFWSWFDSTMVTYLNIFVLVIVGIILQTILFPAYLSDPFQPNLLSVFIVYLGFRAGVRFGASSSFLLGLIQDSLSGIYFGLNGFSYLLVFFLFHEAANRLYTESRTLMILGAFLASVIIAFVHLLLLLVFSVSEGSYVSLIGAVLPQGLMNALASAVLFSVLPRAGKEEST
jgi:rod shape-determining protein MreD